MNTDGASFDISAHLNFTSADGDRLDESASKGRILDNCRLRESILALMVSSETKAAFSSSSEPKLQGE